MKQLLFSLGTIFSFSLMNGQTTVFQETFDAIPDYSLPVNWVATDLDGDSISWMVVNGPAETDPMGFSGKVCVTYGYQGQDNVLSSSTINIPAASTLTFLIAAYTATGALQPDSHYAVYILPSTTTFTTTATPVLEETFSTGDVAVAKTLNLASYAGQNVKVYFRLFNLTGHSIIIDDVKVTQNVLGTSEITKSSTVGIYPNPTTDFIYLKSQSKIINTEVYDMTGRKIKVELNDKRLDVHNLQPGNYVIKIETKEGTVSQKFVKK